MALTAYKARRTRHDDVDRGVTTLHQCSNNRGTIDTPVWSHHGRLNLQVGIATACTRQWGSPCITATRAVRQGNTQQHRRRNPYAQPHPRTHGTKKDLDAAPGVSSQVCLESNTETGLVRMPWPRHMFVGTPTRWSVLQHNLGALAVTRKSQADCCAGGCDCQPRTSEVLTPVLLQTAGPHWQMAQDPCGVSAAQEPT